MSPTRYSHEKRRAPRVDVFLRVDGVLMDLDTPVLIHDLSRTGFAVISPVPFVAGVTFDFRLTGPGSSAVTVSAEAVHTAPMRNPAGLHLTGFKFVPGRLIPTVPVVLIDRLIEAVSYDVPAPSLFDDALV